MNSKIDDMIKLLDKYDEAYYNDTPLVTDKVYDSVKDSLLKLLPGDHPYRLKIGHKVQEGWEKVAHGQFMGSQNKVCSEPEIRKWIDDIKLKLGVLDLQFVVQFKIDGFSLGCYYRKGTLKEAVSRGDGYVGENITTNAVMFRGVVHTLPIEKDVSVRGEACIEKSRFERIQKLSSNSYKNARNAASGIGRRFDGKFSNFVSFFAFDVNAKVSTEMEKIDTLTKLGFKPVPTFLFSSTDDIIDKYVEVMNKDRELLPFSIDGLVLKVNRLDYQDHLGVERGRPVHQIALKFDPSGATSDIVNIVKQIGRTGKCTPVGIIDPIDIDGSTVTKVSLHNFDYIRKGGIGIGSSVVISKKGDIIPQVEEVLSPGVMPDNLAKCPSCGGPLVDDSVNLWCRNKECKERDINRIVYWIETLDIKGFSGKFVEKLWDAGKLRKLSDLYKLKENDFLSVDGIGEKTIRGFFSALKDSSEMYLSRFIIGLGIESCSKSTAEDLVDNFGDWDKIVAITTEDLQKLPGYALTSATIICDGLREVSDMAAELLKVIKIKRKKAGPLTGSSFCVTGSLSSLGRKEFYDLVVDKGGIAKNSVSEGLTYLVSNDNDSGSSKAQKAKKYGVKIITEEQFLKLLGDSPVEKKSESKDEDKKPGVKIVSDSLF